MNRLIYSNRAIQSFSSARNNKLNLLRLDIQLLRVQTNRIIMQLKGKNNKDILTFQLEEQSIGLNRKNLVSTIANDIYMAIDNAIKAIQISVQGNNYSMVMLDDHMLQNIANFIDEYYKNDEIKTAIRDRAMYTQISHNIMLLSMNSRYFMPGLKTLQKSIM